MYVLTCHFLSFYAIFALKFCLILTKDFNCLNFDNLKKQNLSIEGFSLTDYGSLWLIPLLTLQGSPVGWMRMNG